MNWRKAASRVALTGKTDLANSESKKGLCNNSICKKLKEKKVLTSIENKKWVLKGPFVHRKFEKQPYRL